MADNCDIELAAFLPEQAAQVRVRDILFVDHGLVRRPSRVKAVATALGLIGFVVACVFLSISLVPTRRAAIKAPSGSDELIDKWGKYPQQNAWGVWGQTQPATTTAAPATTTTTTMTTTAAATPKPLSREEQAKRAKVLAQAQGKYSEYMAEAFAALAKISYCGPLPGIYAAVTSTCSAVALPGVTSSCERAEFGIEPGSVRTFAGSDWGVAASVFGYAAKVVPYGDTSTFKPGVIISIRGSIDNMQNSQRDKQSMLKDFHDCKGCGVHKGYHASYHAIHDQLSASLHELGCWANSCTIYFTGHASGAAMATMLMWELELAGYGIGPSYLFESPQIANTEFAERLTETFSGSGEHGPVFQVTHAKDSLPRWPFDHVFKSWGIEAYYKSDARKPEPLCWAGDLSCGIHTVPEDELTNEDSCKHPLAPSKDFCTFADFVPQCYGGLGFSIVKQFPDLPMREVEQPADQTATNWYPAEEDGEQAAAVKSDQNIEDYYSLDVLKAMAALAKISYCGPTLALANVVQSTCTGRSGVCKQAGFGVVPNTVRPVGVPYRSEDSAPYYVEDTLFFYTALIRRTTRQFAGKPSFMPSESCVLVFRGTSNEANSKMNSKVLQVPIFDEACANCTANQGILEAWKLAVEPRVMSALKESGCEPKSKKDAAYAAPSKVFITGHSMGGTMATLATYMLHKQGFEVELSWSLEGGRPGNPALMDYINNRMITSRPVPLWEVTNRNDGIPRTPKSVNAGGFTGVDKFQVWFPNKKLNQAKLCTQEGDDSNCGNMQFQRKDLHLGVPSAQHCSLPYAPSGQMCMIAGFFWPSEYAVANECSWGGALY
mmetsp:Transcript_2633/g.10192  ORF Transcript_2633/g.10192 Transcript_2633/m.10192 type:complete len:831 (-) Transcript_2633:144-2636(-)